MATNGMDVRGRWITEADYQRTVALCEELSAQVRRLKRERAQLRSWLRWALKRCEVGGVYVSAMVKALAMKGAR